jgi:hypothetical protein
MPISNRLLLPVCAAGCLLALAQEPSKVHLTARELFYSAATEQPGKKDAPKAAPKTTPAPAPKTEAKAPAKTATKTVTAQRAPLEPETAPAKAQPQPPATTTAHSTPATLPGGGQVVQAVASSAPAPASGVALGLKYTILKRSGNEMVEVAPDSVFRAGDRIQFNVQTNGAGYLYIISQGTSGTWKPMFPSPEVESGDNRVEGFRSYAMPPGSRIVFDEQTGVEKIFIVFSREPETDLERMIYSLDPKKPQAPKVVQFASVNIDDMTVGRLRTAYSRDLIIERVDDKAPAEAAAGGQKEKAVYVVNPSGSSSSRVVADLKLVHQ